MQKNIDIFFDLREKYNMNSLFFVNPIDFDKLIERRNKRDSDIRGAYFRDTTAIIHSNPFRRLKHKTQVFFAPENDHICTRIEHSLHVATISATICKALNIDSDLAWAIGLGHDLGHTPFGHVGEKILDSILKEQGGFNHEAYSLRVVDLLINQGKGLNLTYAVKDGILSHCGEKFEQFIQPDFNIVELSEDIRNTKYPCTWEGTVVRMSDKIAYMGRDLEDALSLGVVTHEDVPQKIFDVFGKNNGEIINTLVNNLISTSLHAGKIGFSDDIYEMILVLVDFNYANIYKSPILSNYHRYFERILRTLYNYLEDSFSQFEFDKEKYMKENNILAIRFYDYIKKMKKYYENIEGSFNNVIKDYIAGMTDVYALKCISEIMVPKKFESQFHDLFFNKNI